MGDAFIYKRCTLDAAIQVRKVQFGSFISESVKLAFFFCLLNKQTACDFVVNCPFYNAII